MARAAAIDEGAWIGAVAVAASARAPNAPRLDAPQRATPTIVANPPSRLSLAIAGAASLVAHAGILAAAALALGQAPPTGAPDAIAVEFVVADAAAGASAPPDATAEPSRDAAAAQALEPPVAAPSLPAPATDNAPPLEAESGVAPTAPADAPPVAAPSTPTPATDDAPQPALAANDEPPADAPRPSSVATPPDVAAVEPRPIATTAAPAVQPPAEAPKPQASARPKPSPAPTRAALRARPSPRAAAAAQTAGSTPARGADVAAYRDALLARIWGALRYPEAARARGATGAATVSFALDAAGDVTAIELARSSGDGALDAEALAAVRRASPLPPPPAEAPRSYAAPIRFELR